LKEGPFLSKNLTLRFFAAAIIYFVFAVAIGVLIASGFLETNYGNVAKHNLVTAHTHLALLGWVSLTIMGAMYQIVPTICGTELRSKKIARGSFWLANTGIIGMFLGFFLGDKNLVAVFGAVMGTAAYLFLIVIFETISFSGKLDLTLKFFIAAIIYLAVAIFLGIMMATGFSREIFSGNVRSAHAHLALLGFVSMTIMGAMYQMLPMLSLKELYSKKLGEFQFWLTNLGVIGMFAGFLGAESELLLFGGITTLSIFVFASNMFATLKGGKAKVPTAQTHQKEKMDLTVKSFIASILYFLFSVVLGILIASGQIGKLTSFLGLNYGNMVAAHAHLALIGWVTITIMGSMYHLVPMLTWMEVYSHRFGLEEVPSIRDLYAEKLSELQFWLMNLGTIGFFFAMIIGNPFASLIFGILIAIAAYIFSFDMLKVIFHKPRGKLRES